jgi:hypothetical protein
MCSGYLFLLFGLFSLLWLFYFGIRFRLLSVCFGLSLAYSPLRFIFCLHYIFHVLLNLLDYLPYDLPILTIKIVITTNVFNLYLLLSLAQFVEAFNMMPWMVLKVIFLKAVCYAQLPLLYDLTTTTAGASTATGLLSLNEIVSHRLCFIYSI